MKNVFSIFYGLIVIVVGNGLNGSRIIKNIFSKFHGLKVIVIGNGLKKSLVYEKCI